MQLMAFRILTATHIVLTPALATQFRPSLSPFDNEKICHDDARLSFNEESLFYSNLKGYGPDATEPHGMLISNVFPVASGNFRDLLITTVQAYYPFNVSVNTISGDVASVSMDPGSTIALQLSFLDRVTKAIADPGAFGLTFMNFDRITVRGCKNFALSDNTLVEATEGGESSFTFVSTAEKVSPTRAFDLTDDERAGAVQVRCNTPTITVEAQIRQGLDGDSLFITGPSNVKCPKRTTCSDFICPEFYKPYRNAEDIYCAEEECTFADTRTCCFEEVPARCEGKNTIMLGKDAMEYSNLGGKGPDVHRPEGIRFTNVFPNAGSSSIDMVINAKTAYTSVTPAEHKANPLLADRTNNGLHGDYGLVSVSSGHQVTVEVSFRKAGTDQPVSVSEGFFFTIYDFDQEKTGGGKETVKISGYDFFTVSNTTKVYVHDEGGVHHHGIFSSTVAGDVEDNPKHPRQLSQDEMDKSVVFGFPAGTSEFEMTLEVSPGYSARNFEFTGSSILPCPTQGLCSSMSCPTGYTLHPQAEQLLCLAAKCTTGNDQGTCCVKGKMADHRTTCDSMLCPEGSSLKDLAPTLKCESLICMESDADTCCKQTQGFSSTCNKENTLVLTNLSESSVSGGNMTVRYTDVFPYWGRTIDMTASFTNLSNLSADSTPSMNGILSKVQLPHSGSVLVDFRFVDPYSGKDVKDMPDFYLTLLGGSIGMASPTRRLFFLDDVLQQWTVAEDTSVVVHHKKIFELGSIALADAARFETMNLYALDAAAKKSAVSVLLNSNSVRMRIAPKERVSPDGVLSPDNETLDGVLFFGGSSSLTCEHRATCTSFVCPSGFILRENPSFLACAGEACTEDDSSTCCDCDTASAFLLDADELQRSTLGDPSAEKSVMVVSDVFPSSGQTVHLRVHAVGEYYPGNAESNTVDGGFLNINVRTSSETTFSFAFVDNDGKPARVPFSFIFSVFDVDQQADGGAEETLQVTNADWFVTSERSLLNADTDVDPPVFHSTAEGRSWDNPSSPLHLADWHLSESVSFMMKKDIDKFNVTIKVSDGFMARNVLFAGQSNLLCSKKEVCSMYTCPTGKVLVKRASWKTCHAEVCTAQDESVCCRDADVEDVPAIDHIPKTGGAPDPVLATVGAGDPVLAAVE